MSCKTGHIARFFKAKFKRKHNVRNFQPFILAQKLQKQYAQSYNRLVEQKKINELHDNELYDNVLQWAFRDHILMFHRSLKFSSTPIQLLSEFSYLFYHIFIGYSILELTWTQRTQNC